MRRSLSAIACSILAALPGLADTYSKLAPTGTAPTPRAGHSCIRYPSNGRMYVFGGGAFDPQSGLPTPTNTLHALNLTAGAEAWVPLTPTGPPTARMFHTAVYDPVAERMLVFGGLGDLLATNNELWELTLVPGSETWRQMSPSGIAPPARFAHAAVFATAGNQMVVFGGYTGTIPTILPTNDIWVLQLGAGDGIWAPVGIGGAPASAGHQLALDTAANPDRLLLFGAGDIVNQTYTNDVYVRDFPLVGSSWTQLAPAAPLPSPRQGFAEAYDITTNPALPRWLLLGGGQLDLLNQTGDNPGDAYVFEATKGAERWVALVPSNNTARSGLWNAVHDTTASRLVLFGGLNGYGFSSDTNALTLGADYDPRLTAAAPNQGGGGQSLNVVLTGTGTAWVNGTSFANFGPEIRVNSTTVTSATSAVASISIMGAAIPGPRNVGVITGGQCDSAIGLFTVGNARRNFLAGAGLADPNPNQARIYDVNGALVTDVVAYAAGHWGVNVAAGEIDADGLDEMITGPGPGAVFGPQVRAFDETGTPKSKVNYYAYGTLKYGCNVAAGDVERDGFDEILTGAGEGAVFGPHVRGWNFDNSAITAITKINFFAYSTLKYGVKDVGADVEFDGYDEILTAPGPGAVFAAQIRGFNVDGATATAITKVNFVAFTGVQYGANLSGGDVDGDGALEILAAKGPNAAYDSQVKGFNYDGAALTAIAGIDFLAYPAPAAYGARVGAGSIVFAPGDEILTGPGPDPAMAPEVAMHGYNATTGTTAALTRFDAFPGQMYGVNVVSGGFNF